MRLHSHRPTILVAEDDPEVRSYLAVALGCHGYEVELAEDGEEALACLDGPAGARVSLVLLDILMPRKDGLETLREIRRKDLQLPVIMLSGVSSPLEVVEAMKSGATDYLAKPVSHEDLALAAAKALSSSPYAVRIADWPQPYDGGSGIHLGCSKGHEIQALLRKVGAADVPVLVYGETGAGKEVMARQFHAHSPRAHKPFLKVNCAALPSELVESELFGYERGAFTGAFNKKPGKFEMADGGTILLDEIGDMEIRLQAKLLQVLQDFEFERLGGREVVRVDVRVMAATHCDLEAAIAEGRFRADLYYRLNVITIRIPPLRERKDEIIPLAEFLLQRHAASGTVPPRITAALRQAMLAHEWPGNVRELENAMRRFLVFPDPELLARELLQKSLRKTPTVPVAGNGFSVPDQCSAESVSSGGPSVLEMVDEARKKAETEAILAALDATHWNRKQAAQVLNIDYKALLYKMKKLSIGEGPLEVPVPDPSAARSRATGTA